MYRSATPTTQNLQMEHIENPVYGNTLIDETIEVLKKLKQTNSNNEELQKTILNIIKQFERDEKEGNISHTGANFRFWKDALLNTERCQDTIGKTEKQLRYIAQKYYLNENTNKNVHHITFFITENSLLQTDTWKERTRAKFEFNKIKKRVNVDILSSARDARWKNMNHFLGEVSSTDYNNPAVGRKELPHIVICCCHKVRVIDDMEKLMIHFNENVRYRDIDFRFNVVFDEADETANMICKFINLIKRYKFSLMDDLCFISATPYKLLVNLTKMGIEGLGNIDRHLDLSNRCDLEENYRSYKDQDHIIFDSNYTKPMHYIQDAVNNIPDLLNKDKPNIVFAPSEYYTQTHLAMGFLNIFKGCSVCLINGKNKGFFDQDKNFTSFIDYNKKYNIKGELRDTLRGWAKNNPTADLVITGGTLLKRGLTFNTDGFNFTLMFLSEYHLKDLWGAIQTAGRGSGNKKYANKCTIICPKKVDYYCETNDENMIDIKRKNLLFYQANNFKIPTFEEANANTKSFILHYRIFNDAITAKKYIEHLKKSKYFNNKSGNNRRTIKTTDTNKLFHTDSLNTNKSLVRSTKEAEHRLEHNLERLYEKNGTWDVARTGWCWGYENPAIYNADNQLVGGDNTTLKIYVPIYIKQKYDLNKDGDLTNELHTRVKKYLEQLDNHFTVKKGSVVSIREKDLEHKINEMND